MYNTGTNDKYAYGTKTRTVTVSRGNRQGNNALCETNNWRNVSSTRITFLRKITRTPLVHELILSNESLLREMQRRFYMLVESGNVDMAGFIAKIILKNGGYGFSQYHLLALVLDFDPKPELEKIKSKNKTKIEIEKPQQPQISRRKVKRSRYYHRLAPEKSKPIPLINLSLQEMSRSSY